MTNDLIMMSSLFRKFHFTSCIPDQEYDGFLKSHFKMAGDRKHLLSVDGSPKQKESSVLKKFRPTVGAGVRFESN